MFLDLGSTVIAFGLLWVLWLTVNEHRSDIVQYRNFIVRPCTCCRINKIIAHANSSSLENGSVARTRTHAAIFVLLTLIRRYKWPIVELVFPKLSPALIDTNHMVYFRETFSFKMSVDID